MDRFDAMQVFIRVAELASFTKAADSMGMPKGSISMAIQQLESHMGARLLHRTTRKVQLTQDGQIFYERCKDLLADVDEVEALFQQGTANITGRLRVDMPIAIAKNLVIPNLPKFMDEHPGIDIELSSTDRKVDLISEGFDCVIRVGALTDSGLIARPLGNLSMVNCASPDYIKVYGMPHKLEDLSEHFIIHYTPSFGAKSPTWEYFDGEKYCYLKMKAAISVNSTDAYSAACLAGLGIVQAPYMGIKQFLNAGTMVEVLKDYKAGSMPVSMIYPHRRNLSKRVQVFMDWIETLMQEYVG